jgi:hypothetical protein
MLRTLLVLSGFLWASLSAFGATPNASEQVAKPSPKIAWYGQLKDGLAEAKRSNRPILLVSAAPQCQNVSGMW